MYTVTFSYKKCLFAGILFLFFSKFLTVQRFIKHHSLLKICGSEAHKGQGLSLVKRDRKHHKIDDNCFHVDGIISSLTLDKLSINLKSFFEEFYGFSIHSYRRLCVTLDAIHRIYSYMENPFFNHSNIPDNSFLTYSKKS